MNKKDRSLQQNKLYWKWLTIAGNDLGYTKEELHFVLKRQFLSDCFPVLEKDEFLEYLSKYKTKSTREMTVSEMKDYMDKVYLQMINNNITLPLPEFQGLEE